MEYKIETIADLQKVPDDRLLDCLKEIVSVVLDARARMGKHGLALEGVTWIDDGIHEYRGANLLCGDKEEYIPNPKFSGD